MRKTPVPKKEFKEFHVVHAVPIDKNDISSRVNYAKFYAREAAMRGLLTIVWDDGGMFRLYDRHSLSWVHENIASTIVRASE